MFARPLTAVLGVSLVAILAAAKLGAAEPTAEKLDPVPKPLASDPTVKVDYDIVYVRAPRFFKGTNGRDIPTAWPEFGHPTRIDPGYDLVLLKPDGAEEVLVSGGKGAVTDPFVSFDGKSVFYAYHHDPKAGEWAAGADIYRIDVATRKITRLTQQVHTPNTGVADWASDYRTRENGKTHLNYGVYNLGPCPLPGGRIVFTSNRDAVKTPRGYPQYALQLYVMDEDGGNVEKIGHLNVAGALHPVVLTDGRILFSTLESQGLHGGIAWGIWSIHPDGTNWEPVISAFHDANGFHFQSQLSDESMVIENYYNQNNRGFGTHVKLPLRAPAGIPPFASASYRSGNDPKMRMLFSNRWGEHRLPFKPYGMEMITRFATWEDRAASLSDPKDPASPRVGKVTHPSGAPDNHLLTVWTPGATPNANGPVREEIHAGIYLVKDGTPIDEPARMLRIKHDDDYNAQWPRALVPYRRIYGIDEPRRLDPVANDGKLSPHLPEGTPFGLVGTSSLYKRESYPGGIVPEGSVTSTYREKDWGHQLAAFTDVNGFGNWSNQGSDAGLYENGEIHAIRILAMEPATSPVANRLYNIAHERLRILGEIPVRKFNKDGSQPLDPDGNPDTSFLAKIPADVAFTFQTLDKDGMVLNMAQTWHQVRPGEIRNNCGGCHAHSQQPTSFELTAAASPDYKVWDLTSETPLFTMKDNDSSGRKWDKASRTGVRVAAGGVKDVEFYRHIKPLLDRSCVACHSVKHSKPAGHLALDDDQPLKKRGLVPWAENVTVPQGLPRAYARLVQYAWAFQSRRSPLMWKVCGSRLDGFDNDDVPSPALDYEDEQSVLNWCHHSQRFKFDVDYVGSAMPPAEAIAGTAAGPDGRTVSVPPLSDEEKLTLARWIDIGCPIDLDFDAENPDRPGLGWMLDEGRPTLTLASPQPGVTAGPLSRILIGMHDYSSGLDMESFRVTADVEIDGAPAGDNLAPRFRQAGEGIQELKLAHPITMLERGALTVSISDRQGNISRIERRFAVTTARQPSPK